ncbi:MAG: transposase, partial [Zoogloeaceae bacterium]|nr:transposase [Zoogloeaceae bacterium]MDR3158231.1 transposase [Zoogloeaceae bacterium]
PDNIRLPPLPAYAPELNPVERLWEELREKFFSNLVFDSIDALEDHLETALRTLEQERQRIRSIVRWPWIINALLK